MAVGSQELQGLWLNQDAGAQSMYQQGNGPYNIFILDTSSRLGEDGFQEMKEIFASMIDEYAKHPEVDENVAVFVCGRQTKFHHYFSNQYEDIKQSIGNKFSSHVDLCFKAQQYHFDQDYCDLQMSKKTLNMEDLVL
ncbi:uncharacterized protein LOC111131681 isoform X2 [Crassostrea virginica]